MINILNRFRGQVQIRASEMLLASPESLKDELFYVRGEKSEFFREIGQHINKFRQRRIFAFQYTEEGGIPRIGLIEDIKLDKKMRTERKSIDERAVRNIANEILRWRIERGLSRNGYEIKKGQHVRKTKDTTKIRIENQIFTVQLYEQVNSSVEVFHTTPNRNALCFIKLDIKRMPILSLKDIFNTLRAKGFIEEKAVEWINDNIMEISVEPRGAAAKLKELTLTRVNDDDRRYWMKNYGIAIPPDDLKAKVYFNGSKTYDYPASTCYIILTSEYFKRPLWFNPQERLERIKVIAKKAIPKKYSYKNLITLHTNVKPLTIEETCREIGLEDFGRVFLKKGGIRASKPKLLFANNRKSSQILKGLREYGPYEGKTTINQLILAIKANSKILPKCEILFNKIKQVYENELNLGKIENYTVITINKIEDAAKQIAKICKDTDLVLLITPKRGRFKIDFLKKLIQEKRIIKVQTLQEQKALNIVNEAKGHKAILEAIALSFYIKANSDVDTEKGHVSLKKVPFILSSHADGKGETCYGFIDVSRRFTGERREVTIALSVVDTFGHHPSIRLLTPKKGERFGNATLANTIIRLLNDAENIGFKTINRMVIITDGTIINENLMNNFHKLITKAKPEIYCKELDISEEDYEKLINFLKDSELYIVNVIKRTIDRIFRKKPDGTIVNPLPWTYIRTGPKKALLVATELKGIRSPRNIPTVAPVELRIHSISHLNLEQLISREDLLKILKEYCAFSMLDWVSPYIEPKVPAYLKFVQKAGELATSIGISDILPWFTV